MIKGLISKFGNETIYDFLRYERQKLIYKSKLKKSNDRQYILDEFNSIFGYSFSFDNVSTMNEKLALARLDKRLPEKADLVDKYKVRKYIGETIGTDYLIPMIAYINDYDDLKNVSLPNSFIAKATHGSSWNQIVYDKDKVSRWHMKYLIDTWLSMNYYVFRKETQYRNIKPGIIFEELILDNGKVPKDYKIHCFSSGKLIIQVDNDRFGEHTRDFYNEDWTKAGFSWGKKSSNFVIPKPAALDEMLFVAKKLSIGHDYVRIDLYCIDNKVYFGEITFIPEGGIGKFEPERYDGVLGGYF